MAKDGGEAREGAGSEEAAVVLSKEIDLREVVRESKGEPDSSRGHAGKLAAFLFYKEEIEELLDEGYSVRAVWEAMRERNLTAASYGGFSGYVRNELGRGRGGGGSRRPSEPGEVLGRAPTDEEAEAYRKRGVLPPGMALSRPLTADDQLQLNSVGSFPRGVLLVPVSRR